MGIELCREGTVGEGHNRPKTMTVRWYFINIFLKGKRISGRKGCTQTRITEAKMAIARALETPFECGQTEVRT